MVRLIKAETYKLFKNRTFKVLCVLSVIIGLFLVGTTFMLKDVIKNELAKMPADQQEVLLNELTKPVEPSSDGMIKVATQLGFSLNELADPFNPTGSELFYSSFGRGIIPILVTILIGALVAKEYSSGTLKNILAYGNRRESYYFAKFIALTVGVISIQGIVVFVPTSISTFLYGWGATFTGEIAFKMMGTFFAILLVNMSVIAVLMLLGSLVKSNGSIIALGIGLFALAPMLLSGFQGNYEWFDSLFQFTPYYQEAILQMSHIEITLIGRGMFISLIIILVALTGGMYLFKYQDIK